MSIVCCLLFVVCCLVFGVCCLVSAVVWRLFYVVWCLLFVVCCLASGICCLLSVAYCLLLGVCCMLSVVCRLLSVVWCLVCAARGRQVYTNVDEAFHIKRASRSLAKTGCRVGGWRMTGSAAKRCTFYYRARAFFRNREGVPGEGWRFILPDGRLADLFSSILGNLFQCYF